MNDELNKKLSNKLGLNREVCMEEKCNKYPCISMHNCKEVLFPDFFKPENFLKLLNLEWKNGLYIDEEFGDNTKDFEEVFIEKFLEFYDDINDESFIRKEAQKIDWSY